jgi:uncharacterized membrane protein
MPQFKVVLVLVAVVMIVVVVVVVVVKQNTPRTIYTNRATTAACLQN